MWQRLPDCYCDQVAVLLLMLRGPTQVWGLGSGATSRRPFMGLQFRVSGLPC